MTKIETLNFVSLYKQLVLKAERATGEAKLAYEECVDQLETFLFVSSMKAPRKEDVQGKTCPVCKQPATRKIEETVFEDDPDPSRPPRTSCLCEAHFNELMIMVSNFSGD